MNDSLKTPQKIKQEQREENIFAAFKQLMQAPGAMKTVVVANLMETFSIKSYTTIWRYIKKWQDKEESKKIRK